MVLERPHRGDDDDRVRGDAPGPADDVDELLHPHVGAEPRLGDHVLAELQPQQVGDQRRVAVRDVGERAGVHQARLPLERLDQVGLDRVLEQHGHRPGGAEVLGGNRIAAGGVGGRDPTDPLPQVLEVAGDGEDRHHLRRGGDIEAALARVAVGLAAEPERDLAQGPIVHVDGPLPRHAQRVDAVRVAVQDRRVEDRREQVVRGADRVDVAGEVKVEVLHRHDLGEAAPGRAALHPEHRADRRLAKAEDGAAADVAHALGEPDRGGRLALSRLGRRHPGDADELAVRPVGEAVQGRERDLALVATVGLDLLGLEVESGADLVDRQERRLLGDLEAVLHLVRFPSLLGQCETAAAPSSETRRSR